MVIRIILQKIIRHSVKPFIEKFILSSTRSFSYRGLELEVPPGVFHPGLFFSSKFFARFVETLSLEGKSVLDLGTGSGIQGLVCAKMGALVTATDVNPLSLKIAKKNAFKNNLHIDVIESDLFSNINRTFDIILVNPPYFPKDPTSQVEKAWYCGNNHDFFTRFFGDLLEAVHPNSLIFMVLSDVCELDKIKSIANENGFRYEQIRTRKNLLERLFIFQIMANDKI